MKKTTTKKRTITAIAISIGIILIIIIYMIAFAENKKSQDGDVLLREYPVTRGDIIAGTDGAGSLVLSGVPQNFPAPVKLEEIYIRQGDSVKTGDMIALASQKDLEQKLHDLNVELTKAKIALDNARNAKNAGALDAGQGGEADAVRAEYDAQKAQTKADTSAIKTAIASIEARIGEVDARISEIDELITTLPPEDDPTPLEEERAALVDEKTAKEKELAVERNKLKAANETINQIENAKNQKLNEIAGQNVINQQKKSIEADSLTNGIVLAQIDVDEINRKIEQTEQLFNNPLLTADRDGLVLDVNYVAGSETTEEKPVTSVGSMNEMYAHLQLGQSDIVDVREGQDVELIFDAFPERTFMGKVTGKSFMPAKDSNPVMYQVNVSVNTEEIELLPGMTCNAQFIIKQVKDVLVLSNKAIKIAGGKQVVLLLDERGKYYEQQIETGFSDGKFSEVLSGLTEGQIVYVEG